MRKPRKNYSPEEKLSILKRHLVEGVPVSDLCDELQLNPNVFYGWQKQLFENGAAAFQRSREATGRSPRPAHRATGGQADPEERGPRRTDAGARGVKKSTWGTLKGRWVPHDTRDEVVDFVNRWSGKDGHRLCHVLVLWLGVSLSKFYDWRARYGKVNEHNAQVPRDHWLEEWEKQAIIGLRAGTSAGRLSAAGVHDARRRRGGGQPGHGLPRAQGGRADRPRRRRRIRAKARASTSPRARTSIGTSTSAT